MRTIFTLDNNGYNEPTIWVRQEWDENPWEQDPPEEDQPIISLSDLPADVRHHWPTIVARLVHLEEEA